MAQNGPAVLILIQLRCFVYSIATKHANFFYLHLTIYW